jgi:hypothetical protein
MGVMKTSWPLISGFLLVTVLLGSGCASMKQGQGTVVPITQADLPSLAGVWDGWAYAGANGFPGELTLRPDGYFNNSVGAFTSTGTFQLQNGTLVSNPYVSGGLSNADAAITVQLVEKNGQRYLSGTGTSNGGPYSFEYKRR